MNKLLNTQRERRKNMKEETRKERDDQRMNKILHMYLNKWEIDGKVN